MEEQGQAHGRSHWTKHREVTFARSVEQGRDQVTTVAHLPDRAVREGSGTDLNALGLKESEEGSGRVSLQRATRQMLKAGAHVSSHAAARRSMRETASRQHRRDSEL